MKLILQNIKNITKNTPGFYFKSDEPFTWKPGQFLQIALPHPNMDDRGDERWFTIASAPSENTILIATRFYGEDASTFKKALMGLRLGESIYAKGPDGDFVFDDDNKHRVLIAGGIGITPFRSILKNLEFEQKSVNCKLLHMNKSEDVPFKDEIENIASAHPDFTTHYFIGENILKKEDIQDSINKKQDTVFYISGPEPMVETYEKIVLDCGVSDENIKRDFFPGYELVN